MQNSPLILDKNSNSIAIALFYMKMRSYQLLKYSIFVDSIQVTNFGVIVNYSGDIGDYVGVYILKRYRGKRLLRKIVKSSGRTFIDLYDNELTNYCLKEKINFRITGAYQKDPAYVDMREYLGQRISDIGIHDVNKVEEYIAVLEWMKASPLCKIAICYMTKMITYDEFDKNWNSFNSRTDTKAVILASEYRRLRLKYDHNAVSAIPKENVHSEIRMPNIKEIDDMILASIIVDYHFFEKYYKFQHPRAGKLELYYTNWLSKLTATHVYQAFKNKLATMDVFDDLIDRHKKKKQIKNTDGGKIIKVS